MQPKKKFQGLEALDPSLGLIFPSQGLTLARQCIILRHRADTVWFIYRLVHPHGNIRVRTFLKYT